MIRFRHKLLSAVTLTFCLAAQAAWAQETSSLPEPSQDDLTSVEQALTQSKARQAELAAAQQAAHREEEELSDKLVTLAMTASEQEQSLARADKRLKKLSTELAKAKLALAAKRNDLSKLLAGLQRLQQDPPPALVVNPDDVLQALRGAMMFSAVVPELRAKADALKADLKTLDDLKQKLEAERLEHSQGLEALAQSRTELTALISQKQAAAEAANTDLATEREAAAALALKAETLRDLLAKLAEARAKAEEARLAEATRFATEQEKQIAAAKAKALAEANAPPPDFAGLKAKLRFPTTGEILSAFGSDTGLGHTLPGLAIKTAPQARITSPLQGKIEFAGQFRSYGGLVIINAGQDYLVLLAGMDKILTSTGQSVKAGEPLGEMGLKSAELAISNDLTNLDSPVLYVEFRKSTLPIDPSPWWVANSQEAKK
jgi:murein hydrolase activator